MTHPGDIADEVDVYVEMGMSPLEALTSATTSTARLFGLGDVGLVEAGYRADLLGVQGDPLSSIDALRSVQVVISGGRVRYPEGRET